MRSPVYSITLLSVLMIAGCATPGDQVKVPTMSVEDAWNQRQQADFGITTSRIVTPSMKPALPYPVVSAPDIRLAFIKSWIDLTGNRHYGNWVAIQVDNPKWVLPDGSLELINAPVAPATLPKPRG